MKTYQKKLNDKIELNYFKPIQLISSGAQVHQNQVHYSMVTDLFL